MATVLTVDADESAYLALQDVLAAFGHTLYRTTDGDQTHQVLATTPVDVVLVDVLSPGIEVAALVRRLADRYPRVRLVGLTAYTRSPEAVAILDAGASCLMQKPFEIGRLLKLIEVEGACL